MKTTIKINGEELPCIETMAAALLYEEATGTTTPDFTKTKDLLLWLWCLVKGACARNDMPFDMDLLKFSAVIEPAEVIDWVTAQAEEAAKTTDSAKKKKSKSA